MERTGMTTAADRVDPHRGQPDAEEARSSKGPWSATILPEWPRRGLVALALLALAGMPSAAGAGALSAPATPLPTGQDCSPPGHVIDRFYLAVEQGQLAVFGQTLHRDEIRPVRVEYAYELASHARIVSVHVELARAIPVPHDDTLVVRKVAAVMRWDGTIVESHAFLVLR